MTRRVRSEDCNPFSFGYAYATFVMHDVTSHKKHRAQVTQDYFSFVIFSDTIHDEIISFVDTLCRVSKATICSESGFMVTFSQKYMLQMFKNVM